MWSSLTWSPTRSPALSGRDLGSTVWTKIGCPISQPPTTSNSKGELVPARFWRGAEGRGERGDGESETRQKDEGMRTSKRKNKRDSGSTIVIYCILYCSTSETYQLHTSSPGEASPGFVKRFLCIQFALQMRNTSTSLISYLRACSVRLNVSFSIAMLNCRTAVSRLNQILAR